MKKIYLLRHCEATGQLADATLTENGFIQAEELANFLEKLEIKHVKSSPFTRAIQTVEPFCKSKDFIIETDDRLMERDLGLGIVDDWFDKFLPTFTDLDLKYGDGESSFEAKKRILEVIEESESETLLVSHGNLLALALMHFGDRNGFDYWQELSNPDVFVLTTADNHTTVNRIWG